MTFLVSKDMDTEVRKVPLGVTASYVHLSFAYLRRAELL